MRESECVCGKTDFKQVQKERQKLSPQMQVFLKQEETRSVNRMGIDAAAEDQAIAKEELEQEILGYLETLPTPNE